MDGQLEWKSETNYLRFACQKTTYQQNFLLYMYHITQLPVKENIQTRYVDYGRIFRHDYAAEFLNFSTEELQNPQQLI